MNNGFTTYVFDLDGTLIESHKTIYNAMIAAFEKLDINYNLSPDDFNENIGLHFEDIFSKYAIVVPDFEMFLTIYKKLYFNYIDESTPYSNVESTLQQLKQRGKQIALLTTKAQDQADLIIEHFNFSNYFDLVMGRRVGIAHKPDPQPLRIICDQLTTDVKSCIMVGDTEMDIRCGKNAGSKTCGVTFGYRHREFLKSENPDYLINNLQDILSISNEELPPPE
jgi:HAD superfamily hydrolase (TIGR01549 family)